MISEELIQKQLNNTLENTEMTELGEKFTGKVRDVYSADKKMTIIVSDRLSAFDKVLTTIPFKGQVLNQIAEFWFDATKDIIQNQIISVPDPNVMIVKKVKTLPIEVIVRGYITGSAWRDYKAGKGIPGITLPEGMKKDQKFDTPLFTPSTKAEHGMHDEAISEEEIVAQGLLEKDLLAQVKEVALKLFARGTELCAKQGMILVDTKYEFGIDDDGKLILIDEIHTPDSSRFWYADTYAELFEKGEDQRMLDKEYLRQWLINERNFMGDGEIPDIPEEIKVEVAKRYIQAYEEITGKEFSATNDPIVERIKKNLL